MAQLPLDQTTSGLGYFERHPVRAASSLNSLGLALWGTVRYPDKIEEKREPGQEKSNATVGEKSNGKNCEGKE